MLIEFSSTRPRGWPVSVPVWERSYRPGVIVVAVGAVLSLTGASTSWPVSVLGQATAIVGAVLLGARLARRNAPASAPREPRQWTITDDELRSGDRRGSVRWSWDWVAQVVELPDAYLLLHEDTPHGMPFDVPRDALTTEQDGQLRSFLAGRGLLPTG